VTSSRDNPVKELSSKPKTLIILLLLTLGALLVAGYHPYAEDAEIYLPGVEKILHPELFPSGQAFFLSHAGLTLFPNLVAFSLRVLHLPMEAGLFLWQVASIFLLLLACWELSGLFFPDASASNARARWGGVCLVAALLTIPVAGTALYIMDQYLNPRNLAAFAGIFAVTRTLEKKYVSALLWLVLAAAMHPLMWVFPFSFCVLLVTMDALRYWWKSTASLAGLIWLGIPLAPATTAAYHEAAKRHGYHYIQHWAWYEWLGIIAPLTLLGWFARIARDQQWNVVERVSRTGVVYGLCFLAGALVVDLPARFEVLARLQPLRSLHLLYIVLFVLLGGFLAEYVLKNHVWRWLLLFVPMSIGMFLGQRSLFPASAQVEWPSVTSRNPWAQAFVWIRQNTPTDAVFALDPESMHITGEDEVGFRSLAQRSRLADGVKDSGVVSMFPPLAEEWWAQVQAQTPWQSFRAEDFQRLKNKYGVSWVVVQQPAVAGLDCAYQHRGVSVCRIL
jgi:hypothetical protein